MRGTDSARVSNDHAPFPLPVAWARDTPSREILGLQGRCVYPEPHPCILWGQSERATPPDLPVRVRSGLWALGDTGGWEGTVHAGPSGARSCGGRMCRPPGDRTQQRERAPPRQSFPNAVCLWCGAEASWSEDGRRNVRKESDSS